MNVKQSRLSQTVPHLYALWLALNLGASIYASIHASLVPSVPPSLPLSLFSVKHVFP